MLFSVGVGVDGFSDGFTDGGSVGEGVDGFSDGFSDGICNSWVCYASV